MQGNNGVGGGAKSEGNFFNIEQAAFSLAAQSESFARI